MADVVQLPGVGEQLKLIVRLRWTLFKNGLQRKNNRWDIVGIVFAGFFSSLLIIGLCAAFFAGTYSFLAKNRAGWIAILFLGDLSVVAGCSPVCGGLWSELRIRKAAAISPRPACVLHSGSGLRIR